MKPINALVSSIQLPLSSAVALKSSFRSDTDSNSGEKSLGINSDPESLNQQIEQSNDSSTNTIDSPSPPTSSSSNETSSTKLSYKPNSGKTEKKSIMSGKESTQLGIVKHLPPSNIFMNNKVASSFRNQEQALMNYQQQLQASMLTLPVTSRKVRDSASLLLMLSFLGFLVYIIWDGLIVKEADINLIVHGHDSYGNICGRNNRPIKFVEKSGRNYSDKQYTKYTLINAQFERYTLDSDRLKQGEFYYIKQGGEYRLPPASIPDDQERARQVGSILQSNKRSKRSIPEHELLENREQLYKAQKNQTLLNNLKSSLMYQYPPMYGYHNQDQQKSNSVVERTGMQHFVQNRDNDSSRQEVQTDLSTSQSELTYYRAAHPKSFSTVTPSAVRFTSTTNPSPSNLLTKRPAADTATTPLTILYDDHLSNDSDHYEHMLIKPISTNFYRPRTTNFHDGGLDHNEVSSQLLYLTECVEQCPADHIELIFYRCMPRNWRFSLFPNAINVTRTFIDELVTDVSHCYRELIYIFSFALVLSLALLILLRFLASVIIWSCLTLLISLFLSMAGYSWYNYYNQILELNNAMPHDSIYAERLASSDKWLIGAIFLTFIAFASIGTIIFMRKRILLVTMLFRESGKAIADMPLLLLQPLLTFAALVAIILTFSIGLICLQSMKIPVIDMNTGFVVFKAETLYKLMKWYHIFAFLWVSHFAIACQHYVIGASVSKWYFSTNRYNLHSPIGASVSELILYYLGSVALGSFLVAIFKVIRIITRQIQYLVQRNCLSASGAGQTGTQSSSSNNFNSQQISSSCCGSFSYVWRVFIWFFDNIVMIINRDAYVEIAIYGDSFLAGAQRAFTVLASNPLKLLAIKSVSNVLLVVAKICVVFGTISMATMLLEEKTNQLNYSWSPVVISAIYAYIVAHWFLSVYEMVIDALFICYCEDYERSKERDMSIQITGSNFMSHILNNSQLD